MVFLAHEVSFRFFCVGSDRIGTKKHGGNILYHVDVTALSALDSAIYWRKHM